MRKLALLTILAISTSFGLSAQETNNPQKEQKNKQVKEQTQLQKENQDRHGQAVSQVAKETPSGPGKGEVVSAAARSKGEAKKAAKAKAKKAKKVRKAKALKERQAGEKGKVQKGPRNTRPDISVRGGAKPGKGKR